MRDWQVSFISAYASMHPWGGFAETFGTYLDMCSVLDTALHMDVVAGIDPRSARLQELIDGYMHPGVVLNEMNRAQGVIDLVPELI